MKDTVERKLGDLVSVGPAIRRDFELLGIRTVTELAKHEPQALYDKLCLKTGTRQDRACWTRSGQRSPKHVTRSRRWRSAAGGTGAGCGRQRVPK
jgi:hypothetical protein